MSNGRAVGEKLAGAREAVILSIVLVVGSLLLLYTLIQFWPAGGASAGVTSSVVNYFGVDITISDEGRLFVVVMAAGALGGMIHALRSLSWYVGNRTMRRSWVLMYCLLPFVGALLGTVFYIVLRGGLLTAGSTQSVNAYGFAAVSALVGLFSEQAAAKLKEVFSALFAEAPKGKDHTAPGSAPQPTIIRLDPERGAQATDVRIEGTGLETATAVEFGRASATPKSQSDTEVEVTVPEGAESGPVTVVAGETRVTSKNPFTVLGDPGGTPPG